MIDCHAHISDSIFDRDREDVIIQARQAGVKTIIAVSDSGQDVILKELLKGAKDIEKPWDKIEPELSRPYSDIIRSQYHQT